MPGLRSTKHVIPHTDDEQNARKIPESNQTQR
ncbi:unnamed protein product, partial [marine sediment metagenome]